MFSLLPIDIPGCKKQFLLLLKNGICLYEQFEKELEASGNYYGELNNIQSTILSLSKIQPVADGKHKPLRGRKRNDLSPDYEFRTSHLRVYSFMDGGREIITFGSVKDRNRQETKDIPQLRKLKQQYFEFKSRNQIKIEQTTNEKME